MIKKSKKILTKKQPKSIVIFESREVRRVWDEKEEKWYFSVVDVVQILIQQLNHQVARNYWKVLKNRLKKEGNESVTKCNRLKFEAADGKSYLSDAADTETLLRLIQSVPSPKAEPIKLWLARVGYERLKETVDPEIAVNRARENWQMLGRSKIWIEQRMRGQEIRNKLTDYWTDHEVSEKEEFAVLTNIIHREWSGVSVAEHKKIKSLKGHNLRDNMTEAELIFTALAELSTRNIAEKDLAVGFSRNAKAARKGGKYAGKSRKEFEKLTGKKVVTRKNYLGGSKNRRLAK